MQIIKPLRMNRQERKKLAIAYAVLIVAAVVGMAIVIWLAWLRPIDDQDTIQSYDDCVRAGYAVQDSYPEVCTGPAGQQFVNPDHL